MISLILTGIVTDLTLIGTVILLWSRKEYYKKETKRWRPSRSERSSSAS